MENQTNQTAESLSNEQALKEYNDLLEIINKEVEYFEAVARKEEAMLRVRVAQVRRMQIEAPAPAPEEDEDSEEKKAPTRKLKKD